LVSIQKRQTKGTKKKKNILSLSVAQTFLKQKIQNIGKVSGWLINLSKWEKHSWS
jgi:hypothetical protein